MSPTVPTYRLLLYNDNSINTGDDEGYDDEYYYKGTGAENPGPPLPPTPDSHQHQGLPPTPNQFRELPSLQPKESRQITSAPPGMTVVLSIKEGKFDVSKK